jgi:methyltransferase-like protein
MSIEQKIAELLAESKAAQLSEQVEEVVAEETVAEETEEVVAEETVAEEVAEEVVAEALTIDVSEDVAALINGEELTEEFKTKAATIFEAAVVTRIKQELARMNEEFEAKLEEAKAQNQEGLVEKVDGYLGYVVEQWIAQNELALEHGMKSEILEGFVAGLKGLFEEHYIDIPEEKFDVLGSMEVQVEELTAKLDEQVAANVELTKSISELKRSEIVTLACEGLSDTEVEKFKGLAEELSYEDVATFGNKVQTIRENYFTTKAQADVTSVVTDAPVETLTEEKKVDPQMAKYLSALNYRK